MAYIARVSPCLSSVMWLAIDQTHFWIEDWRAPSLRYNSRPSYSSYAANLQALYPERSLRLTVMRRCEAHEGDAPSSFISSSETSVLTVCDYSEGGAPFPITSCISQSIWYSLANKTHVLNDLQIFGEASRGLQRALQLP
jgi:hypothetical protein